MDDRILNLVLKYENKSITESEFDTLSKWVDESKENKDEVVELLKIYRKSKVVDFVGNLDDEKTLKDLELGAKGRDKKRKVIYAFSAAATLLLLVSLSVTLLFKQDVVENRVVPVISSPNSGATLFTSAGGKIHLSGSPKGKGIAMAIKDDSGEVIGRDSLSVLSYKNVEKEKIETHTISVPVCGEYRVVLSDGTKVWLNSDSKLTYPTKFSGDKRMVSLKGEGYFEVSSNKEKPFIVRTPSADIKVLGTKFNISAYTGDSSVKTTLAEGSVAVSTKAESVILSPGQQASVYKADANIEVKEVDVSLYTAWAHGVFEFQSMKMEDIAQQLTRWYGVEFFFMNKEQKELRFTGAAKRMDNLNELLKNIEKTTNIKFDIKKGSIIVR